MIFYLYSRKKLTPDFEAITKISASHRSTSWYSVPKNMQTRKEGKFLAEE